ncbi:hypothetical protein PaecuDRAFT_2926 [Paenibacillus curdlanolyticus YK9]|uniref:TVP38/TMEM64 family membrane protein n=1 Tax=Paenibacillus curdlanolyticus YK9 TaxID=717606 RepID=E0IAT6_9BACL|nr:VTT domain-containing protein [Paenibacillus curdlanolyticus]EFM10490.1 hypothetical protein PaecuDRAFT_2926 [Paenibacillus curdlanolyticus YK9]
MKVWRVLIAYALLAIILYYYRHDLSAWMENGEAPLWLLFLVATALAFVPILPYKIVIGALGIMYGPWMGALLSWLAANLASVLLFMLVQRYFYRQGRAYLKRYRQTERFSTLLERRPFLIILVARLIPVFPSVLVNIVPAVLSIRLSTFAIASALGKIPAMLTFAFLGHELMSDPQSAVVLLSIYAGFLLAMLAAYWLWQRRA